MTTNTVDDARLPFQNILDAADYLARNPGDEYAQRRLRERIEESRAALTAAGAGGEAVGMVSVPVEKLYDWRHRARLIVRDGHRCDAVTFSDAMWQGISALLKGRKLAHVEAYPTPPPAPDGDADIFAAYKTWPEDIRAKLSMHDLRRMGGWVPPSDRAGDWRIDTSAGGPILVHNNCSVIQDEQARYVLNLIAASTRPAPDMAALVEKWRADEVDDAHSTSMWDQGYAHGRNACADELEAALQAPRSEGVGDDWSRGVASLLSSKYGLTEEAALAFASVELSEYRAGQCDCAEYEPVDFVDLVMGVMSDCVEAWKRESARRPFGYKQPKEGIEVAKDAAEQENCK